MSLFFNKKNFFNMKKIIFGKFLKTFRLIRLFFANKFYFPGLLGRLFNKSNLKKILIVFIVGFTYRMLINYTYDMNIFAYYLRYLIFSIFISLVHEVIGHFNMTLGGSSSSELTPKFKTPTIYQMKPYKEIEANGKANSNYRPSSLSNPPVTPNNCPATFTNPSITPINRPTIPINYQTKSQIAEASAIQEETKARDLAFQEKNRCINKCKEEFKEFYTTYRDSIKLSDYELEKLSIKIAKASNRECIDVEKAMNILPKDIQPIFRRFILRKLNLFNKH
jgi:hypothetical protein